MTEQLLVGQRQDSRSCLPRAASAALRDLRPSSWRSGRRPVLAGYLQRRASAPRTAGAGRARLLTGRTTHVPIRSAPSSAKKAIVRGAAVDEGVVFGEKDRPAGTTCPPIPLAASGRTNRYTPHRRGHPASDARRDHAHLGDRLLARRARVAHRPRSPLVLPFLADHRVDETVVFPAAWLHRDVPVRGPLPPSRRAGWRNA